MWDGRAADVGTPAPAMQVASATTNGGRARAGNGGTDK